MSTQPAKGAVAAPAPRGAPAVDEPLGRLVEVADELGVGRVVRELRALAGRVAEGRFYVACFGQFKRGKSTLINALVGEPVLPAAALPVTAVPTILRYGRTPLAEVRFTDGESARIPTAEIASFVTEDANPGNVKRVEAVEVELPAAILRSGLCLVDTPGLGSVFAVATGATRSFVPHVDAAILVIGADPPLSADEAALAEEVATRVPDLLVVLTKADRVTSTERGQAAAFAGRVLAERLGREVGRIFQVSATERLAGDETRDWAELTRALERLAAESGRRLVAAARERGVRRLAEELLGRVQERRAALLRPVVESERRLAALHDSAAEIRERLLYLGHLLAAEQGRLRESFRGRRERFLARAREFAAERLEHALDAVGPLRGPVFRRRAAAITREVAREVVDPWLEEERRAADAMYREVEERFSAVANAFLEELAASGGAGLEHLPRSLGPASGLRAREAYYFQPFMTEFVSTLPLQWLADALAPPRWTRRRIRRAAHAFLQRLLDVNSARVSNDLDNRVRESRRQLEAEVQGALEEALTAAERAERDAAETRAQGAAAVSAEVDRLEALQREVRSLVPAAGAP